jgi:hypothetical protein
MSALNTTRQQRRGIAKLDDIEAVAGITIVQILDAHMDSQTQARVRLLAIPQHQRVTSNGLRVGMQVVFENVKEPEPQVYRITYILYAFQTVSGAAEVMLVNAVTGAEYANGFSPNRLRAHVSVRLHG